MKRLVSLICGCWIFVSAIAQPQSLCITTAKTTSLIFPFPISHVDRGTKDVLVEKVKEADNILLVKAAIKDFKETNLSVITEDGSLYAFTICYHNSPATWVYQLPILLKATVAMYANGVLDNQQTVRKIHDRKWNIKAFIKGLYVKDQVIYYQLEIHNISAIDYDINILRFYIRDKKKGKRTASQETELKPLYVAGNRSLVKAHTTNVVTVALEKFTIPDAKYLAIEIMEKNGGRNLFMKVKNKNIIKAIRLPDLK